MAQSNRFVWAVSLVTAGVIAAFSQSLAAESGTLPAVSGLNGKLDLRAGSINDSGGGLAEGAISIPLEHRFGLQFDGVAGSVDSDTVAGGAAHLFWRDPSEGLAGLYGSYSHQDRRGGIDMERLAVEGERYLGRFTLSGLAGMETGDVDDSFFSLLDLSYHPDDDVRLYVGHRYAGPGHAGVAGVEWQVPSNTATGISLFGEARKGEGDANEATLGVRFYFGEHKTLLRRHREDDPAVRSADDVFSLTHCTSVPECKSAATTSTTSGGSSGSSGG